jgi:hypothetical protein
MPVFGSPWQKGDLFVNISVSTDINPLLEGDFAAFFLSRGGSVCNSSDGQGLELLFASDALGSGITLQEHRMRNNEAFSALLLSGDNITVNTRPLSHMVVLSGIDLTLRGSTQAAIMVHMSCFHTNGEIVTVLLEVDPQPFALNMDTWRAVHFSSHDSIHCPAAARVSVQVSHNFKMSISCIESLIISDFYGSRRSCVFARAGFLSAVAVHWLLVHCL